MGCDFPLKAYRSQEINPETGRSQLTFNPKHARNSTNPIDLPCGRCTGCKLERSRQWAVRIMHESQCHPENSFLTLTFANEHLPVDYSVDVRDTQLFLKRLRDHIEPRKIRFFLCGEYGDKDQRPHYHIILFNYAFLHDRKLLKTTRNGDKLYTSATLEKLWPFGQSSIGNVTFNSAAYTARYAMKKITGDKAEAHYLREHPLHHFIVRTKPEFLTMSRRPGIGFPWINKYMSDVYPSDEVIVDGHRMRPPRFYDQLLSEEDLKIQLAARRKNALKTKEHRSDRRRWVKAQVRDARITDLKKDQL